MLTEQEIAQHCVDHATSPDNTGSKQASHGVETDEQRRQPFVGTLARVEEMLRQRKRLLRHASQERQELRRNAGKPCGAPTKTGAPCGRKGYANGLCGSHGGKTR